MIQGTLVLVLYYTYTYQEPINRILLFTVLLPIQLLSISNLLELRFQVPQIQALRKLLIYYKQRDGLNLQQQQQQQQQGLFGIRTSRTYLIVAVERST